MYTVYSTLKWNLHPIFKYYPVGLDVDDGNHYHSISGKNQKIKIHCKLTLDSMLNTTHSSYNVHYNPTLQSNTTTQHYNPTLQSNTTIQHYNPTLQSNNSLYFKHSVTKLLPPVTWHTRNILQVNRKSSHHCISYTPLNRWQAVIQCVYS